MKTFRSYQLAVQFYHSISTLTLPRHLKDQVLRAGSSVALNLAEGSGRKTGKDKQHFYRVAFASMRECQAVLDLAPKEYTDIRALADMLAAHIYKLIAATK